MKVFNSHTLALKNLQHFPRFPKTPKVVIFGAPNVAIETFAKRLAMDIGVPAISMRDIYKNILSDEDFYKTETFYRKVIDLLKNYHTKDTSELDRINKEMEDNYINEKLLTLTKYSEMGFVLYDYPRNIRQCEK